jgi:hypothetical protein
MTDIQTRRWNANFQLVAGNHNIAVDGLKEAGALIESNLGTEQCQHITGLQNDRREHRQCAVRFVMSHNTKIGASLTQEGNKPCSGLAPALKVNTTFKAMGRLGP